jgi:hypothetical protein
VILRRLHTTPILEDIVHIGANRDNAMQPNTYHVHYRRRRDAASETNEPTQERTRV